MGLQPRSLCVPAASNWHPAAVQAACRLHTRSLREPAALNSHPVSVHGVWDAHWRHARRVERADTISRRRRGNRFVLLANDAACQRCAQTVTTVAGACLVLGACACSVVFALPVGGGLTFVPALRRQRRCAWSACSFASLSCPAHKQCRWVARGAGLATGKLHSTL